jgi:HlyD family secretion protein
MSLKLFIGLAVIAALAAAGWILRNQFHPADLDPASATAPVSRPEPAEVTALGRIEPEGGVVRLAGPADSAVISKLFIEEGDMVSRGQVVAVTDQTKLWKAEVWSLQAELDTALRQQHRYEILHRESIVDDATLEAQELKARQVRAQLEQAKAELDLAVVRSPINGRVLKIHARAGEKIDPSRGIAELGRVTEMNAVAEVYETDIGRVRLGQRATITSPALHHPLYGTVKRIGLEVAKQDVLSTDPAARTDARIVEVEIRLDNSAAAADLSRLQVEVSIDTRAPAGGRVMTAQKSGGTARSDSAAPLH